MDSTAINDVFRQFAPILWDGLKHPERSNGLGGTVANSAAYPHKFGSEIPLDPDEVVNWDQHYKIKSRIAKERPTLFVPRGVGSNGNKVRVNMENITYQPLNHLWKPDQVTFHLCIYAYIGFSGNQPYNAFIGQSVYAKNTQHRWIYQQIEGGSAGVFNRFRVAETSLWFNLQVEPEKINALSVGYSKPYGFMLQAKLNQMPKVTDVYSNQNLVDAVHTDFFFWQVMQFMEPSASKRNRKPLM